MFTKIGLIGCGTMGSTVARLIAANAPTASYYLANRSPEKAEALAKALPGSAVCGNSAAAAACDLLVLGVKPQIMPSVMAEIAPVLKARKDRFVLVTMAAGISCAQLREMASLSCPVIRIMPNTPVSIGRGVIEYCGLDTSREELAAFAALLQGCGTADEVEERLMDAAMALSGCGPAFAYLFIEALADGAVACGLPRAKALAYAAQTVEGAAALVKASGKHPGELKDAVCSPGGTTIEGVRVLEEGAFRGTAMDAVIAAYEKSLELK